MKNKILLFCFAIAIVQSCKSQEHIIGKLKDCINLELEKRRNGKGYDDSQSIENTFKNFEAFLKEKYYLEEISKAEYQRLIDQVIDNPKTYKAIDNHINDSEIYYDHLLINNPTLMLSQCTDFVLVTEKNDYTSTLNLQSKIVERIIRSGYGNKDVVKELFMATPEKDFNNIFFRIPFMYVVIMNAQKGSYQ